MADMAIQISPWLSARRVKDRDGTLTPNIYLEGTSFGVLLTKDDVAALQKLFWDSDLAYLDAKVEPYLASLRPKGD